MSTEEDSNLEPSTVELVAEPIAVGAAAILSIIPILGASAATALSIWQTQNYRKFAQAVRENFDQIDQAKLDKAFLESDEFKELVIQSVEASIRTASDQKCQALANALLSAVVQPTSEFSNKPGIIRVISQMSDEERTVLKVLHDYSLAPNKSSGPFISTEDISEQLQIKQLEALTALDGLQQLGLAFDFVNTFAGLNSRRGLWSITALGSRCSQYALKTATW